MTDTTANPPADEPELEPETQTGGETAAFDWGITAPAPVLDRSASLPPGEAAFDSLEAAPAAPAGNRKLLWWVVGGLAGLAVAVGAYVGVSAAASGGSTAASPSPSVAPTAPAAPGTHAWSALYGGECLSEFESAWQESFEVVDCAEPHAAQLVFRGELDAEAEAAYPGEAELATATIESCTRPGVIDANAASGYADLQLQSAFPVTEEQWAETPRVFYCFIDRAGGEPIEGSLQGSGPAA